ncbi:MAG: hypothetical protein MZV70_02330 [Desulfobacterales bacterium]|nr:hypothetical protein [Desulfobacterales bacterium]
MLIKSLIDREVPARGCPWMWASSSRMWGRQSRRSKRRVRKAPGGVITVTGEGIKEQTTSSSRSALSCPDLIEECGEFSSEIAKVVSGGPMMGLPLCARCGGHEGHVGHILVLPERGILHAEDFGPCIRCVRCMNICPMGLMPSMLEGVLFGRDSARSEEVQSLRLLRMQFLHIRLPFKEADRQLVRLSEIAGQAMIAHRGIPYLNDRAGSRPLPIPGRGSEYGCFEKRGTPLIVSSVLTSRARRRRRGS